MSRIVYIVTACLMIGCTSPYRDLTRSQATLIERAFQVFSEKHGLTNFCYLTPLDARTIHDLEGANRAEPPPRFEYPHICRFFWLGEDSLYRGVQLVNRRDVVSTLEQWRMMAFATSEAPDETRAVDTVFAQSNDIRTFQDSIASYLEEAHRWTLSKRTVDLKLVWKRE